MTVVIVAIVVAIISEHHGGSSSSTTDSAGSGFASAGSGIGSAGDGFASGGAGADDTTTTAPVTAAPPAGTLNDNALFRPTGSASMVSGFDLIGLDQTRTCAADVTPAFAATLAANGCQAILRGLYVDGDGDVIVAEDLIVLADSTDAKAVGAALQSSTSSLVNATPTTLASITPQPLNPDSLPAVPASAGPAGAVQTSDPGQAPGGDRVGTTTENQFVLLTVGAYDDGRKASSNDGRLQQAVEDVTSAATVPLSSLGADGGTETVPFSLGF